MLIRAFISSPRCAALAIALLLGASTASALNTSSFTPQGEVANVRQIVARFNEDAVKFGDPRAAAPFTVSCDQAEASRGQGRWNSAREWVYEFAADLPPGVRCQAEAVSGFKSASGASLTGASSY